MAGPGRPKTGGRKKGTPNKVTADLRAAAREYTTEGLAVLLDVMRASASDHARVAAVTEVLNRGWGRATQHVDVEGRVTLEQLVLASFGAAAPETAAD